MSLASLFQDIADAIRTKITDQSAMTPSEFPDKIASITGVDVSGVTAEAGDVKIGKTFVNASGVPVNGTMPVVTPTEIALPVNGTYTIPAGNHYGTGTVKNVTSTKAAETFYAGLQDQTIAANQYLTGAQIIKALTASNLNAANIKKDVTVSVNNGSSNVFEVTGTYEAAASQNYVFEVGKVINAADVVDHTYGYYTAPTTVAGTVMKSYKVELPEDAKFLIWEAPAYWGLTDGKQWFRLGFIKDLSYKGVADGSGYVVDGNLGQWQCASFCERPDNIYPNKKAVYVPVEKITSGGTTIYKVTYVIGW